MSKTTRKVSPDSAKRRVGDALANLAEAIIALEDSLSEELYEKAFNDGVEWLKSEFRKIDPVEELDTKPVTPMSLTDIEKLTDQCVNQYILDNPGLRTTDIIVATLKLPVKPALTEQNIKSTINRLKREAKIDNKAGRWYSTQVKTNGQQYQVMAYLPDGSKYLGTDVIKETT